MTISVLVALVAQLLTLAIVARALLSWMPPIRTLAPVTALVTEITDPMLKPIQRRLPAVGGLDLSPVIAILLIGVGASLVRYLLAGH